MISIIILGAGRSTSSLIEYLATHSDHVKWTLTVVDIDKNTIDRKCNRYKNVKGVAEDLKNSQICLSGFSQGCMMSLNVGLTSKEKFLCIVGFSGKIINQNNLKERLNNLTDTLLIHGDMDQVVSSTHLLEAKDFLIRNNVKVETLLIKDCDHHIPVEASSTALNYILKRI